VGDGPTVGEALSADLLAAGVGEPDGEDGESQASTISVAARTRLQQVRCMPLIPPATAWRSRA
jgi:hypothetical protein